MIWFRQGPDPRFLITRSLQRALRELRSVKPVWPSKAELLPFALESLGIPADRADNWYREAWWGYYATRLVRTFIASRRADEALALIDDVDWTLLEAALGEGKGALLASAHVGPYLVLNDVLRRYGCPVLQLAANPAYKGKPGMVDVSGQAGRTASLVRCLLHLRRNHVTLAPPDGRAGGKQLPFRLFNQDVLMHYGCAELARLSGAPSLFFSAGWGAGERIRVIVRTIEFDATQGDEIQWIRNWTAAYLDCLAQQLLPAPADFGFWAGLFRTDLPGGLRWLAPGAE